MNALPSIGAGLVAGAFLGTALVAYIRARIERRRAAMAFDAALDMTVRTRKLMQQVLHLPICERCDLLYVTSGPDGQVDHPYCPANYVTV